VLSTGAGRPIGVDLQIVAVDLDARVSSMTGATSTPAKAAGAANWGVERRQAHEPVHALLGVEEAVGVLAAARKVADLMPASSPGLASSSST
jgi:hypothetical protein